MCLKENNKEGVTDIVLSSNKKSVVTCNCRVTNIVSKRIYTLFRTLKLNLIQIIKSISVFKIFLRIYKLTPLKINTKNNILKINSNTISSNDSLLIFFLLTWIFGLACAYFN